MRSLITIVAPIWDGQVAEAEALIDKLGNPARSDIRTSLERLDRHEGFHFMSLHALPAGDNRHGHIVLEFTADAEERSAVSALAETLEADLAPVFALARDRGSGSLSSYLLDHRISIGQGLFSNPGLAFAGTPGMTVSRIRDEARLAAFVGDLVEKDSSGRHPLDRLESIRRAVAARHDLAWALETPAPPLPAKQKRGLFGRVRGLAFPFLKTYCWPLGLVLVAVFAAALLAGCSLGGALEVLGKTFLALLGLSVVALLVLYAVLRKQENSDWVDERAGDISTLQEIGRRENFGVQNHMISVTERKPGPVRWLTLRLAFWFIRMLAEQEFQPGHLGSISSIHAARWVTLPGTRTLVFFSNYGGSWESYLEDFITRANYGLTGVWSNSVGFPRARNLFQGGATDGERFKRYARASMRPTRFWYNAYPDLTTSNIRTNAAIRRGLAVALTNEEAKDWLSHFGSAPLPDSSLESREIQSIVFGGLGFMPEGSCLVFRLPDQQEKARGFIAGLLPHTAFGDGRRLKSKAVLTVALGAGALAKLGLPESAIRSFPPAFLEGMSTETRSRILGDTAANAPEHWEWGGEPVDLALLVYGVDSKAVAALEEEVSAAASAAGMAEPHRIPLKPVEKPATEPFGFVDGVSQPIIRGTYQSYRKRDRNHLVDAGEFVIGYPDNRGNLPPEPLLSALDDPSNLLPVAENHRGFAENVVEAPRAVARNGSYLVIRQLEQDVAAFQDYCAETAGNIETRLTDPYRVTPEFIGAKLVGRWKDGSSILRNPYYSATEAGELRRAKPAQQGAEEKRSKNPSPVQVEGDNDFLYGVEDPSGRRCPFGAHIRRANPRESFDAGSEEQIAISNRHRILRVGRLFEPQKGRDPGILFMCLNGDIERQFEFVQQTWLVSPSFHGLSGEQDPLTTSGDFSSKGYVVPSAEGPLRLKPFPHFVKPIGGAYLFVPSRSLLAFLGSPAQETA